jgi:hypothetical protein
VRGHQTTPYSATAPAIGAIADLLERTTRTAPQAAAARACQQAFAARAEVFRRLVKAKLVGKADGEARDLRGSSGIIVFSLLSGSVVACGVIGSGDGWSR